jgi:Xaa-Pro dipeptidase
VYFTRKEFERRLGKITASLDANNLDMLVTMAPENIYYVTGHDSMGYYQYQAAFVARSGRVALLIRNQETAQARGRCWHDEIIEYRLETEDPYQRTVDILRGMVGHGRIGVEKTNWYFTVRAYETLKEKLPACELVDASNLIGEIRLLKSDEELVYVRKAAALTDYGQRVCLEHVREGVPETHLHAMTLEAMHREGADYLALPVLFNTEGKWVHRTPVEKPLRRGEVLCTEITGCYRRYNTNQSRAASIGPPSAEVLQVYRIVRDALERAIAAVKPGIRIYEIDRLARQYITDKGYGAAHLHRTAFGIGIGYPPNCTEPMSAQPNDSHVLEPGMQITIEPGIYLESFAIRLGDNVLVTDEGHKVLHEFSRDLVVSE